MARLTRWNGKKWILPQGQWREIAERLAAYENTGLEPQDIRSGFMPKLYKMEITSGECYHKEIWFGNPSDVPNRLDELRRWSDSWGWYDAIIIATEIEGKEAAHNESESND